MNRAPGRRRGSRCDRHWPAGAIHPWSNHHECELRVPHGPMHECRCGATLRRRCRRTWPADCPWHGRSGHWCAEPANHPTESCRCHCGATVVLVELEDLDRVKHRCVARWQRHGEDVRPWSQTWLQLGQLADGRWYVWETGQVVRPVAVFAGEAEARSAVRARMGELGGEWRRVPCYPTEEARRPRG